ncbi:MAG: hypothetical protein HUU34_01190 [Saprospiraceae bacterium]|jgi:hypothetical protein|nr:hypothetical protein [Saprospiraceae bacterium]
MSLHLSAGKIPGHSGTDFKHKKAFTKIKAYRTLFPEPLPPGRFEDLSAKERQLLRKRFEERLEAAGQARLTRIVVLIAMLGLAAYAYYCIFMPTENPTA